MPLPKFTDDEQYLITGVKSPKASGAWNSYMWGYLLGCAIIAGFGAYYSSIPMMLTAFVVVCGFRIYEDSAQAKWETVWRSIIAKYEALSVDADPDGEPPI
jgi:hypothetical protein